MSLVPNIRWTVAAGHDLREGIDLAISRGPGQSRRLADDIEKALTHLQQWPGTGKPSRLPSTREYLLPDLPYRLIYTVEAETLVVLRFLHTSRRWPKPGPSSKARP